MKAKVILVVLALAVAGFMAPAAAQSDAEQPSKAEQLRQRFKEERAEVLSKVFEKRAELVRLSAKKAPDVEEVQRLVKEISELRSGLRKKCVEYRATAVALGELAVPGAPALGARPWGAGRRSWYNAGRGQRSPGSRLGLGARGKDQRFGRGRGEGPPRAGMRGRGAPGRGRGSGPYGGRIAPQAGPRDRGPLGGGFGHPGRPVMGGRAMRPWGQGPLSDDVSDEPAPPSE